MSEQENTWRVEARRVNEKSPWGWYAVIQIVNESEPRSYGPYATRESAQKAIDENRFSIEKNISAGGGET